MSKKPRKIEESATSYSAKKAVNKASVPKSTDSGARRVDEAAFQKAAEKVFRVHRELLHKLAQ